MKYKIKPKEFDGTSEATLELIPQTPQEQIMLKRLYKELDRRYTVAVALRNPRIVTSNKRKATIRPAIKP